jgi:hypothetical protein
MSASVHGAVPSQCPGGFPPPASSAHHMAFDDIYLVTDRLEIASAAEIAEAERELGSRCPSGYAEYVQRFGKGSLDDLLRLMLPGEIVSEVVRWQSMKGEFWFWDEPHPEISIARVLDSVPVADTENGDEICFHPEDPDALIVLPRDEERLCRTGPGLVGALDCVFTSGALIRPHPACAFESHLGRKYVRHQTSGTGDLVTVRDDLASIGLHALVDGTYDDHSGPVLPRHQGSRRADETLHLRG